MKTFSKLFLITAIFAVLFSINAHAQDAETHYITLTVNTGIITVQNASEVSNFGQPAGVSNEEFTISARVGDTIIWRGFSSYSENDVVNIKAINYEGGVNIFDQNVLLGNGADPEMVIATVVTGNPGDTIKYKIQFTVFNNGTRRGGTYNIDPKIQVKS